MTSPKQKIIFIINPVSGVYKKDHIPEKVRKYVDQTKYDYTIRFTEYAGHAKLLAEQAVQQGFDVVVAVGGDGSINEVAQSLVGTKATLGIIPVGSGNGFGTHLRIPPRQAKAAIGILNTGKAVQLDLVKSNLRYFVSNAGFGLDSSVARRFNHHRHRGFFSYAGAVIKELLFYYKPMEAKIEIDDKVIERPINLFTAFNANQYGYGFGIFPATSMKDGVMDVIVLYQFPFYKLLYILICLLLKRPGWVKEAEIYRAKRILIHGNKKMNYQFDGDSVIHHEDVIFEVMPKCIHVIVPEDLKDY